MTKAEFLDHLHKCEFTELFTESFWNNPSGGSPFRFKAGENEYVVREVAQKGMKVFVSEVEKIPDSATRRLVDAKLRKICNDYILIFVSTSEEFHHLWSVPVKTVDKRQLVTVEYASDDQAEFLLAKLNAISFSLDEEPTIVDVVDRVNSAFLVNSADVTKKFYRGFSEQHKFFAANILNVAEKGMREWYASVMLNRLMFCYFIQKKGFLNFDENYLGNKLKEVQARKGEDKFYESFYRSFLKQLFSDGLDKPAAERSDYFKKKYGTIPYLNGGMFSMHRIEKENKDIDIPDKVFERLFEFFDLWRWHLDTRITANGRDINPDVLGYIFEQYINDRAQMGAYYTKEDITEYITRNTLVPWLVNETAKASPDAFGKNGFAWKTLRESGDRYIFPAVRKGVDIPLPQEIERGVAVEPQETLRKRRAEWNKPAAGQFALPTEIWRETVARRLRCRDIRDRIASGEITDINDFITWNLDIRTFAEDLIRSSADHLFIRHFYNAVRKVTVLDPTCGSGAFLFAALNVLEPLYEACLDRMEEFHEKNSNLFKVELAEITGKFRSNRQYFIYKNIILRNLYGVDIMPEAVEIARLRLFLKMVAVVDVDPADPNLGLDPLPDIDFNIRCGNTLVGFVSPEDVKAAIIPEDELALNTDAYDKVERKAEDVADLYEIFKREQQKSDGSAAYHDAKKKLNARLRTLDDELDRAMARRFYDINPNTLDGSKKFQEWKRKTIPFHWFSEFYAIIVASGGFDVIIGNPPYVVYTKKDKASGKAVSDLYTLYGYATMESNNLYAFVMERCIDLIDKNNHIGMIVPLSFTAAKNMRVLRNIYGKDKNLYVSSFEIRPSKLFDGGSGADQRLNIVLCHHSTKPRIVTTGVLRWTSEHRNLLFHGIYYEQSVMRERILRFSSKTEMLIWKKFLRGVPVSKLQSRSLGRYPVHYRSAGLRYWIIFLCNGFGTNSTSNKIKYFESAHIAKNIMAALNSNVYWWYYATNYDMFNQTEANIDDFCCAIEPNRVIESLADKLEQDMESNKVESVVTKQSGGTNQSFAYNKKLSKPIIDEIDELLAKHYGFTEEELDFIINYDIKYRMGDKLNSEE